MIMTIIMMVVFCILVAGFGAYALWAAKEEKERSHLAHLSALEAANRSKQYHEAGQDMFEQALDSYKEGQQFWAAATEALLDAKRRERKVDDMVDQLKAEGVIPFEFNAGEEAA